MSNSSFTSDVAEVRRCRLSDLANLWPGIVKLLCCKLAVIFCERYAFNCIKFCSNDCFSTENADFPLEGIVCSGEFRIHNSKAVGSSPTPATNKINNLQPLALSNLGVPAPRPTHKLLLYAHLAEFKFTPSLQQVY